MSLPSLFTILQQPLPRCTRAGKLETVHKKQTEPWSFLHSQQLPAAAVNTITIPKYTLQ